MSVEAFRKVAISIGKASAPAKVFNACSATYDYRLDAFHVRCPGCDGGFKDDEAVVLVHVEGGPPQGHMFHPGCAPLMEETVITGGVNPAPPVP